MASCVLVSLRDDDSKARLVDLHWAVRLAVKMGQLWYELTALCARLHISRQHGEQEILHIGCVRSTDRRRLFIRRTAWSALIRLRDSPLRRRLFRHDLEPSFI